MKKQLRLAAALGLTSALAVGQSVFASGFEKPIMFGGQTSGTAGIGSSWMEGSQALYFNPAGLVSSKANAMDVSLNLSPTMINEKQAFDASGNEVSSNKFTMPFSLMWGHNIGDKFGYGIGVYTVGGGEGDFTSGGLESKLDLQIYEAALGVAYKVTDSLKIGAAWRVDMVDANLIVQENLGGGNESVNLSSLTGTQWAGWKVGAQYKLTDRWDWGLVFRSEQDFKAKGNIHSTNIPSEDVTVGTALPESWTLGTSFYVADTWKMFAEYVYTNYHTDNVLNINSANVNAPLDLMFKDQNEIKIAAEYKGWSWPVRFGYIFTSQVTDQSHMLPGLVPPGTGHTLTLGTGQAFNVGGQSLRVDGGLEYAMVNGSSNAGSNVGGGAAYSNGSNSANVVALHLGAQYAF